MTPGARLQTTHPARRVATSPGQEPLFGVWGGIGKFKRGPTCSDLPLARCPSPVFGSGVDERKRSAHDRRERVFIRIVDEMTVRRRCGWCLRRTKFTYTETYDRNGLGLNAGVENVFDGLETELGRLSRTSIHNMVVGRLGGRAFGEIVLNKNNVFSRRRPTRARGDLYRPVGPRQRKQTMNPA